MIKKAKVIACLYAGIVAANAAETIEFNGEQTVQGHEFLRFDIVTNGNKEVYIKQVRIDESRLNQGEVKNVTLIVPGEVADKQVNV